MLSFECSIKEEEIKKNKESILLKNFNKRNKKEKILLIFLISVLILSIIFLIIFFIIERNNLKESINKIKLENDKLELIINKFNIEKNELKNITNEIKEKNNQFSKLINNLNEENENLKNYMNNLENEKDIIKNQLIKIEKEKEELKNKSIELIEENNGLKNKIEKIENDIIKLKGNLEQINTEKNNLESRIDYIENEKDERNKYFNTLFSDSKIIQKEERKLISNYILPHYNLKYELLYSATKDGFDTSIFHSKCDYKGPTLFVIKLENNRRFGGFTTQDWDRTSIGKIDEKAFLFSLDKKIKFGQKKKGKSAIYGQDNTSVLFGPNNDEEIKGDDLPIGGNIAYCREEALKFNFVREDICGEKNSNKIVEFEVYSVKNYLN